MIYELAPINNASNLMHKLLAQRYTSYHMRMYLPQSTSSDSDYLHLGVISPILQPANPQIAPTTCV